MTATSRTLVAVLALVLVAGAGTTVALTAGSPSAPGAGPASPAPLPSPASLPGSAPAGWRTQRSPLGATLAAPASWRAVRGDRNSLSAVEPGAGGVLAGYLNLTPRQGAENAASWERFRLAHLSGDGEHGVRAIAYSPSLRLRAGHAACLTDAYTTSTGARYEELACIVEGPRSAVILGAAPTRSWATQEPVIARAIAAARP